MSHSLIAATTPRAMPVVVEDTENKHSRAILKNDTVYIRLARGLSLEERTKHIDTLVRRITQANLRRAHHTVIDPFHTLRVGKVSTLFIETCIGAKVEFHVTQGAQTKGIALPGGRGWHITRSSKISDHSFGKFLWKLLSHAVQDRLQEKVLATNARTLGVPITGVKVRYAATNWGSCSRSGIIALSTPLLCTSIDLVEYVIIHELAHIREMNHSTRFWAIVATHCPGYRLAVQRLRHLRTRV